MAQKLPPNPDQFPNIGQWARSMYTFLSGGNRFEEVNNPLPVLLPHRSQNVMERAATDGIMLYDPTLKTPVYSVDGRWEAMNTDYNIQLALGNIPNAYSVEKFGRNLDIDTGTVPEDVWNGSQLYTGFQVGAEAAAEVVSSSASDTGTVYITGLRTPTSTEYETASYTLTGTTPVSVGSWWRANSGYYDSGNDTTFNIGTITVRQVATPANIYIAMPIGQSQTTIACWTVPFGSTAVLRKLDVEVSRASASATIKGALWTRRINESPRYQFQFIRGNAVASPPFEPKSGVVFPAQTDISVQIVETSANNIEVLARFGLAVYKDA
jgi:hypothetical protein